MKTEENEKYVGDVISCSGSNDANISRRRSIGIGSISSIFAILSEVTLGQQYIVIGLVMRESILLSKMLLSAESWHKLFLYQIEKLEEVDRMFFRQLFNCHSKTAIEFYYIESASIPIRIKVSAKRLMYWWHILHVDKSELIYYTEYIQPRNCLLSQGTGSIKYKMIKKNSETMSEKIELNIWKNC